MRYLANPLATLYELPNEVNIQTLEREIWELFSDLQDRFETGKRTVLPAKVNGITRWYGFARSDHDGRLLREEMNSWLGPPLSDGTHFVDHPEDDIDRRAATLTNGGTLLETRITPDWQREARENVRNLVRLWMLTPNRTPDKARPVGRVLRQFYEAVTARNRPLATDALEEIRTCNLLSATNIRFLRIELLGTLGTAHELKDDPQLEGITLLRRPPAVSDHLARGADALFMPPIEAKSGPDTFWSIALDIEKTWPRLIAHPSQVRSVHGARCLALSELLVEQPRQGVIEFLRLNWSEDALVERIITILESAAVDDALDNERLDNVTALAHLKRGHWEQALDIAESIEVRPELAGAVMHAALNLGDTSAAARAVAIVDRLSEVDRDSLLAKAVEGQWYEDLIERNQGTQVPADWISWLQGEWPDRPDLLGEWSATWSTHALRENEQVTSELALELIDALNDDRRVRVRNGLPVLVQWLTRFDQAHQASGMANSEIGLGPTTVHLAVTIFDIMLDSSSEPGRSERSVALELLDEILRAGCSGDEYREITKAIENQLKVLGPREVNWLAQILDLQLFSAVPDSDLRHGLFAEALKVANSWYERISAVDALVLRKLFADAHLQFAPPPADHHGTPTTHEDRGFARVGIYSLSESAAQNAARWIRDEWPDVDVRLSHAHVNNRELQNLARNSDVVLMQTSHAKHAATIAIERSVEQERLVYVNGRGASSLFHGLLGWIAG